MIHDWKEGRWVSCVPTLNDLATHGTTRDETLERTKYAIVGYLKTTQAQGLSIPDSDTEGELVLVEI